MSKLSPRPALALALALALAVALPASAQKAAAPAPQKKTIKLPTAADGEVFYTFDASNLPISAKDDRAEVVATALSFLPKKAGEQPQWVFLYSLSFKADAKPLAIVVYSENKAPLKMEVADAEVHLQDGLWSATSKPRVLDKATWDSMIGKDPWVLQTKFAIQYADGNTRSLHQLAVITQKMRLQLLEQVSGQKLLAPAK